MTDTVSAPAGAGTDHPPVRPASATAALTGFAGIAGALVAMAFAGGWLQPTWLKTLAVFAATAAAMALVDVVIYRTHRRPSTGLARDALRPFDARRVAYKLLGLWLTIGAVALAYTVFPEYAKPFYAPFKEAALWCLPALAIVSPFYIAHVDRHQRDPVDAYAQIGRLCTGQRPESWRVLQVHVLGWLVKAFFLPLMFTYADKSLALLWSRPLPSLTDFAQLFSFTIDLFFLLDVLLAATAYALTLRIIDTHIRSVEPTIGGWAVCLACYAPFNDSLGQYLAHDQDRLYWGQVFAPWPVLHVAWGTAILALVLVYLWATAAFGLRFSNLTNRGIITNGPYRWVKHPAYLCKNLSWWLISVPFVAGAGWPVALQSCALLAGANLLYYLRARTEERHLRTDPAYREYEAWMARHGLFARLAARLRDAAVRAAA